MECGRCKITFRLEEKNIRYDESGYGYSTKYVLCPRCGSVCIVEYIEDDCLDVNNDVRYYEY